MKKFQWFAKEAQVLIIDHVGSTYLINWCLPEKIIYEVVNIRQRIPIFFSLSFFADVFFKTITFRINRLSFLQCLINQIKPRIVLTTTDNMKIFGRLSLLNPDVSFLSIQNGSRSNRHQSNGGWSNDFYIPVYLGFGSIEKELMSLNKVNCERYLGVGSLRLGIFLDNEDTAKNHKGKFISIISQWSPSGPGWTEVEKIFLDTFPQIFDIANERKLEIQVILRNIDKKRVKDEIKWFQSIDKRFNNFIFNEPYTFSSYRAAFRSQLVVGLDSTLFFEMLGAYKKVFFLLTYSKNVVTLRSNEHIDRNLPDMLKASEQEKVREKIITLLDMEISRYNDLIAEPREVFMCNTKPHPHEIIQELIIEKCT